MGLAKRENTEPKIKINKTEKTFSYKISTLYFSSPEITTGIFVTIEDSDVMKNALQFYADTKLDFVDCILLSYFKTNNIQVATFDKKLKNKMK